MEGVVRLEYNSRVEALRETEYPMMKDVTYLDHAGTTLYAKSLIERFSADMLGNLYGNPHSASEASQNTSRRIDDVRLKLLRMFGADPEDFDVVFVANATAGIKLVTDAMRESEGGFWYGYHRDSHTSLVGAREVAAEHRCFGSDDEVELWLSEITSSESSCATYTSSVFAYPAQSNMNGRRLPLNWCSRARASGQAQGQDMFTLLDAAAYVSTSPLDFSDVEHAPDFTVLSLYKMFGFPDLGALIVRKEAGDIFRRRKYFGGGTVDMVLCMKEQWHAKKSGSVHEQLEDGTLPFHSIIALDTAIDVHRGLYKSLADISNHTAFLAQKLYDGLVSLRHGNGASVCQMYKDPASRYGDTASQGPVVAFNLRNSHGAWVSITEVEKTATVQKIQLRTGGLCNPGGIAAALQLAPWEMKRNFSAGQRCGNENDIMGGKPTGMIRVSLGAMSTMRDVNYFLEFVREFFVQEAIAATPASTADQTRSNTSLQVESLTVYPIKSCGGWRVPYGVQWEIREEGLAWDREWCLVHQGTGTALSQKRYPRMALLRPSIDFDNGVLRVRMTGSISPTVTAQEVTVPLSWDPRCLLEPAGTANSKTRATNVCGETISAHVYGSSAIADFFTNAIGVPCQLARFPASHSPGSSSRHSKAHLQQHQQRQSTKQLAIPGAFPQPRNRAYNVEDDGPRRILLSNESPILTITRSSLNLLNEQIKLAGGKACSASSFRANIVISTDPSRRPGQEEPYAEDHWSYMRIGDQHFQMLGACRRCHMVCVDQSTAERNPEPFSTLAKTRRYDGKVWFGVHTCHLPTAKILNGADLVAANERAAQHPTITVGDPVTVYEEEEEEEEDL